MEKKTIKERIKGLFWLYHFCMIFLCAALMVIDYANGMNVQAVPEGLMMAWHGYKMVKILG